MIKETSTIVVEKTWASEAEKLQDQTAAAAFFPTAFATTAMSVNSILEMIGTTCPAFKKALDEFKAKLSAPVAEETPVVEETVVEEAVTEAAPAEETPVVEENVTLVLPKKLYEDMTSTAKRYLEKGGEPPWASDITGTVANFDQYIVK